VRASFHSVMLMRSAITDTHWLGLKSLHRRENNGITGSQIFQEEVDGDAVDDYSSRLNGGCFCLLADLPASEEGAGA